MKRLCHPLTNQRSRTILVCKTLGVAAAAAGVLWASVSHRSADAVEPLDIMVRAQLGDRLVEGQPLAWSDSQVFLLSRDGQLVNFAPDEASDYRTSGPRFTGYSTSAMRAQLHEEFGKDYEITGTKHFLVVHPRGRNGQWAERFERMYRSFCNYFRVRGFDMKDPKYPLVAIVFPTQEKYRQYAESEQAYLGPQTLGHYSPRTNRISLYDVTSGPGLYDSSINADTIIHEATHQTAFNTGVHTRFTDVPRWLSEGLATMFEAPGVWDAANHPRASDRINQARLDEFKHFAKQRRPGTMAELIASDRLFKTNPAAAYAESWALSYYLCQTRPQLYSAYLKRTAERPQFEEYTPEQRIADFKAVFGDELTMLESHFLRYIERLQ